MSDTIAAIATGGAISAIGIVRVSGCGAIIAADKMFRPANGTRLINAGNRHMYYGELTGADGVLIDLCLCMVSRAPDSYTGEDTVEFHCHGSPVVLSETLRVLFSHGVRQAGPGEFTKRAFLNGRMDLTQAEAVIDLIEAETPMAAQNAAGQLRGAVGIRLESVYNALLDIIAHFHAVVDYPDEDIDEFKVQHYLSVLRGAQGELSRILSTHERGRVLRDGVPTAIVGRPNTGKSSLLNALLGYDRAIVTDLPGTTRDTVEEKIIIGGVVLRLIDTAGLRDVDNKVEKLGVERTLAALRGAGLAILVLDGSEPLRSEDYEALRSIPSDVPMLVVVNKSDLPGILGTDELAELAGSSSSTLWADPCNKKYENGSSPTHHRPPSTSHRPPSTIHLQPADRVRYLRVSALTGEGLTDLDAEIRNMFPEFGTPPSGEIITNARQAGAISRALDRLGLAMAAIGSSVTPDAVLTDLEDALAALGEVTGKTMREDLISRIFERFCVGK